MPKPFKMSNKILHDSQKKSKKKTDSPLTPSSSKLAQFFSFNNKENTPTSKLSKLFSFNGKENNSSPQLSQKFSCNNKENTWSQKFSQLFSSNKNNNVNNSNKEKSFAVEDKENNPPIAAAAEQVEESSKIESTPRTYYPPRKRHFIRTPNIDDITDDEDQELVTPSKKPRKLEAKSTEDYSDDEYYSVFLKRRKKKENHQTIIEEEINDEPPIQSEISTPKTRRVWAPTRMRDFPDDVRNAISLNPTQRRKEIAQRLADERASKPSSMLKFSELLGNKNDDLPGSQPGYTLTEDTADVDEFAFSPLEQQLLDLDIEIPANIINKPYFSPLTQISKDNKSDDNDCRVVYEHLKVNINPYYEGNWQPSQQSLRSSVVNSLYDPWKNVTSQDFNDNKSRKSPWSQDTVRCFSQDLEGINSGDDDSQRTVINESEVQVVDEESNVSVMSRSFTKLSIEIDDQGFYTCCFMCDRERSTFRINPGGSEGRKLFTFKKPFDKSAISQIVVDLEKEDE